MDQVIQLVSQFGPGALMAKFDVKVAYRNFLVHPLDRYLLGMKWRNHYYVDLTLPFGLRSAPLFLMRSQTWWHGFLCTLIKFPHCSII